MHSAAAEDADGDVTALARDGPIDTALVMAHAPAAPLAPLCESSRRVSSHLKGSGCSKCRWVGCRWCQDAEDIAETPPPPDSTPDSTPLTSANAVGRRVRVPAACWPDYTCLEHGGLGWTGCIIDLKRSKRSKAATVRFTEAADDRGLPWADVQLELAILIPF